MEPMRRGVRSAIVLVLGVPGAALLGGCGSSTKTVSVAGTPGVSQGATAQTTASTPSTKKAPAGATPGRATTNGGTPAPTSTRAAPEPAFTHQEATAEGLSGAVAVVRARGFTPDSTSDYHPSQTLRVLIGTRAGSSDGHGQQAFFFVNGRYIGTDTREPSATLRVVAQGDTEVTVAYALYRKSDPLCCPGGGQTRVRFQLNNGRLMPLDPIPPASSTSGMSRQ
jgi:LppP/LprE lipoprotein